MHARSLALLPDCHGTSSIFAPRYCAPGEWVALAPTNGQQLSEEEHLARAAETHASKELLRAEHHYHAALALNPHNGEAYYRLARLWQHRSNDTASRIGLEPQASRAQAGVLLTRLSLALDRPTTSSAP